MYFLKFNLLLLICYFTCVLGQFSLVSLPKSSRNSTKEPRINSPNTIIRIKVGPKSTFTNESISSLSTTVASNIENSSNLAKLSTTGPNGDLNENLNGNPNGNRNDNQNDNQNDNLNDNRSVTPNDDLNKSTSSRNLESVSYRPKESERTPKLGFGGGFSSFTDKLRPSTNIQPSFNNKLWPPKPQTNNLKKFGDNFKPTLPMELPKTASEFGKLANETANRIKNNPIVSEFLNIPNHFKINSLKSAIDYMIKYGHLENMIDINKPEDLFNLKDAFKGFQDWFGLKPTGLFDQETLNLMNEKRCGLPDKETKFTKLVKSFTGGLIRKKRYELYTAKYETRNLTWTVTEFSKKALKNQNEQVIEVFKKAFEVWKDATNLNFEYKPNTNTTDILIGFYSGPHGNKHVEPPFDGQNGTLAHTSYPTEWDLHLDDDELWSLYPQGEHTDLFSVSIHEIGHKLGLKHSKIKQACLYPIYNSKSTKLDQDDIEGIQSLYGAKQGEKDNEKEVIDKNATEKPEPENENDDKLDDNIPDDRKPDNNQPDSNQPDSNQPDNNQPDSRPNDRPDENNPPPVEDKQAIRILDFNPERNIYNRREYIEQISIPCSQLKIDSSVCMLNNKCLIIAGDQAFWMNNRLKMMRRKKERVDQLFKGLSNAKINSIYRDNDLIHVIQGNNVTTYDSFYAEPVNRTTIDQHFPGLPAHAQKNVHSVFKKLSTGVVYIYSGELYWRYTRKGLERIPRLTAIWGLPGNVKSVLHFNNGKSIYIKGERYWVFDEGSNNLLSLVPGNIADLNICLDDKLPVNIRINKIFPRYG